MLITEILSEKDLAELVRSFNDKLKIMEDQNDDLYKINLYLIRKYKDDLIREFQIEKPSKLPMIVTALTSIFKDVNINEEEILEQYMLNCVLNKIREIMKEEMPEPWYCYGFKGD